MEGDGLLCVRVFALLQEIILFKETCEEATDPECEGDEYVTTRGRCRKL